MKDIEENPITLQCRPHSNGNTAQSFKRAGLAISEAARALEEALETQLSEVTHGRNYQHLPPQEAREARERDLETIRRVAFAPNRGRIGALAYAVFAAGDHG